MWFRNFFSIFTISKTKIMNLEKCYFRYIENESKIDITFMLKAKETDITARQFNLSRKPSEILENLFNRIRANVQKAVRKGNKKKGSDNDEVVVRLFDDMNNPIPVNFTCQELFAIEKPLKLNIYDHIYEVVFNAPWVVSINLPQSILAGFPVYPENLETHYTDKENTIFNWYKGSAVKADGKEINVSHIKWELVGNNLSYTPTPQDVGMKLKLECTPGNEKGTGPVVEIISKCAVEAGPGRCPFETRHMFTSYKLKDESFRCVTYNILADLYCDSDFTRTVLHPYCPPYALQIDYRKQLIIKELLGYNADIICLQEVDRKVFLNCLLPYLGQGGLEGVFHKKGKEVSEGLACFYRKDRFQLLEETNVILSEALNKNTCLEPIWNKIKDNKPFLDRLADRSTIASAVTIQSYENPNEIILIGNTHLYFHPNADHIRLVQGGIVIYWLRDVQRNLIKRFPGKRISLILCGDFNSVPSCGIYHLYTSGIAPSSLPDWKSYECEAVHNLSLEQDISLASACGTPPFTNFTAGFADCLDYIYYQNTNLVVEQVVPLPSEEELKLHTALPSIVCPSDHIALISDLRFKLA